MKDQEKLKYIQIARELFYPEAVIRKIQTAKNGRQCQQILHEARMMEEGK
ncbi:MAG: hypothetical protein KH020_03115 [Clostridiales bacterium]|nr:hypothetical protein [Clostridiales bacterium]